MKKCIFALALLFAAVLCGCSAAKTWETVSDVQPTEIVPVLSDALLLDFSVPTEVISSSSDDGAVRVYTHADGDYTITAQTILSSGLEGVTRRLTGSAPEQIQILQTKRFRLPEYQFVWAETDSEGSLLCRADVLCDGDCYYALTFSVREALAPVYAETVQDVFSSLNLNGTAAF